MMNVDEKTHKTVHVEFVEIVWLCPTAKIRVILSPQIKGVWARIILPLWWAITSTNHISGLSCILLKCKTHIRWVSIARANTTSFHLLYVTYRRLLQKRGKIRDLSLKSRDTYLIHSSRCVLLQAKLLWISNHNIDQLPKISRSFVNNCSTTCCIHHLPFHK